MFVVDSYSVAVIFSIITMLCWGSWANTQKWAGKTWRFELFYWDYVIGILLLSLIFGFTIGSFGDVGRSFVEDLSQASTGSVLWALGGGVVFNAANILFVAAIGIAGMAVAFPIAIGLALVLGTFFNYLLDPTANPVFLFIGVVFLIAAIIFDGIAYKRLPQVDAKVSTKGLLLCLVAGLLMGFWYPVWARSVSTNFVDLTPGMLGPYAAIFLLSIGILVSNFLFNTLMMKRPFVGEPVSFRDYFKGSSRVHLIGILGGLIWGLGTVFNIIASGEASFAISYGLGQSAPMIGALWGIFAWKEFSKGDAQVDRLLALMFLSYLIGLALLVYAGT